MQDGSETVLPKGAPGPTTQDAYPWAAATSCGRRRYPAAAAAGVSEQGHQLVAQLFVAHPAAAFVAGLEQEGEHVVGALFLGQSAAAADLVVDQLVGRVADPSEPRRGTEPANSRRKGVARPARFRCPPASRSPNGRPLAAPPRGL